MNSYARRNSGTLVAEVCRRDTKARVFDRTTWSFGPLAVVVCVATGLGLAVAGGLGGTGWRFRIEFRRMVAELPHTPQQSASELETVLQLMQRTACSTGTLTNEVTGKAKILDINHLCLLIEREKESHLPWSFDGKNEDRNHQSGIPVFKERGSTAAVTLGR